jgi:hypothetical protein
VIHVVKYITTAVMGIVLFLSNVSVTPTTLGKGTALISRILVHEGRLRSDKSAFSVTLFLKHTAYELSSFLIADQRWLTRLIEEGLIHGAYLNVQGSGIALGKPFAPLHSADAGYHIEENVLHFVYRSVEKGIFLDTLINTNRFSNFILPSQRRPRFVLLYDPIQEGVVFLHGKPWKLPYMVYRHLEEPDSGDFFMVTNKIIAAQILSGIEEDLAVVSLYRVWPGKEITDAIALIGICAIAILLLTLSIRYNVSGQFHFWRGATVMSDKKENQNVIHEIDREISDLFEDEVSPEQPAVIAVKTEGVDVKEKAATQTKAVTQVRVTEEEAIQEPAEKKKQAEKIVPKVVEGGKQGLEKDGIIIKKG